MQETYDHTWWPPARMFVKNRVFKSRAMVTKKPLCVLPDYDTLVIPFSYYSSALDPPRHIVDNAETQRQRMMQLGEGSAAADRIRRMGNNHAALLKAETMALSVMQSDAACHGIPVWLVFENSKEQLTAKQINAREAFVKQSAVTQDYIGVSCVNLNKESIYTIANVMGFSLPCKPTIRNGKYTNPVGCGILQEEEEEGEEEE